MNNTKNILVVTYGGGHVKALIPVLKILQQDERYKLFVIGLSMAKAELIKNNIECLDLYNYIEDERIKAHAKVLANKYHNYDLDIKYNDTVAYYGIGIGDLIKKYGEKQALKIFEKEGRKSFLPIKFFETFIKNKSIDLLLTTSSPRFEEAAIIASHNMKIKSVRVEQLFAQSNTPILKNTTYCVLNDYVKNVLKKKGIDEKQIVVTGQPAFDNYNINEERLNNLKNTVLDKSKKNILFISPGNKNCKDLLEALINIEKNNNQLRLIVKLHPNESGKDKEEIIKQHNSKGIIMQQDLNELIILSEVVIIEESAVGLHSILLDKDLITINTTQKEDKVPYAISGAAVGVYDLADLDTSIKDVLYNPKIKQQLSENRKNNYKHYHRSAENICSVIEDLLYVKTR